MKRYTVQFEYSDGNDEFWESNPKPGQVLGVIKDQLIAGDVYGNILEKSIKIVKLVDETHYTEVEEWQEEEVDQ